MPARPNALSRARRATFALAVGAGLVLASCSTSGRSLSAPKPDQTASITTAQTATTTSTVFQLATPFGETTNIQKQYSCEGANLSPPLSWTGVPEGTKELALVVTDPDAGGFVHWVLAGLDPAIVTEIRENTVPSSASQALNSHGTVGWYGPCPPKGQTHHYDFTLYALNEASGVTPGEAADAAVAAIKGTAAANTTVTSKYP